MTRAEQLTDLLAERARLKTALATLQAATDSSSSIEGMAITRRRIEDTRDDLMRVEKSIQRLCRGGRGIPIDMGLTYG